MGQIISISIGKPKSIPVKSSRPIKSSFIKTPIESKIFLGYEGFENDQVGDPRLHGGVDKAVCVYCKEHFVYWTNEKGLKLNAPAFGENLTVEGLLETQTNIGDVFNIGQAQVQVSQPRQPCHKINKVYDNQKMACWVKSSGFTGYYFRVIEQGWVAPGDKVIRVRKGEGTFSVDEINSFLSKSKGENNLQRLAKAVKLDSLTDEWRKLLKKRLP
ncbi:MAG: MOSC domain-containing protein [Candidatus Nitronauta litoralis]|uniref:MOSC domain-containing protein n=1 Tax=Candidatus Nitronauta litoralis TaxID=2705533 RepID=A0A7T0BYK2_9BACT|nr:MAG: MOSC domain-containing protein [Candidatus Nitronauta litoralis]